MRAARTVIPGIGLALAFPALLVQGAAPAHAQPSEPVKAPDLEPQPQPDPQPQPPRVDPQPQPQAQPPRVDPQPQPQPARVEPGPTAVQSDPGRTRRLVGLGIAGGGAILAGVGFFLGVRASATYYDAKVLCGVDLICENTADFERGQNLIDRARSQATLSTVLVVSGAAAVAAGVVVWVTAPSRRTETAVVPVVTDRDLGVALLGRF